MVRDEAIGNCRVSSDEQLKNNSLSRQAAAVMKMADKLGVKLVKMWSGSTSSKKGRNVGRKDLNEMLEFCKKNKKVRFAIFDEVDRFMRSMTEMGYFITEFQKLGVEVKFASKDYSGGGGSAMDTFMMFMDAFRAESENDARRDKCLRGHVKAIEEGRWTFPAPAGYVKGLRDGVHEPNPRRWEYYRSALRHIAGGLLSPKEALEVFHANCPDISNGTLKPHTFDDWKRIIVNPYYAGILELNKQVKARNECGQHKPMISKEEHLRIVEIVRGTKKKRPAPRKSGNPKYPMNAVGVCDNCVDRGRVFKFTGSDHNNGRTKKIYEDYTCRGCGRVIKRDSFHAQVEQRFEVLDMTENGRKAFQHALEIVWKAEELGTQEEKRRLSARIKDLEKTNVAHTKSLSDPALVSVRGHIVDEIKNNDTELEDLRDQLGSLDENMLRNKSDFMRFAGKFVDNLSKNFLSLSLKNVEVCKQIVFPAGFWVDENKKVYTPKISPIYRLKKALAGLPSIEKQTMVDLDGLEPSTLRM